MQNVSDFFRMFLYLRSLEFLSVIDLDKKFDLKFGKLCQKYSYQKLSKSDWFSSYSQKCRGCFFETQCSRHVVLWKCVN